MICITRRYTGRQFRCAPLPPVSLVVSPNREARYVSEDSEFIDEFSLMFESARSLIGGAKIILASDGIEEDGQTRHPTIPVIICCAFAIEVQIKALLKSADIPRPQGDGHDLALLFNALPSELQSTLLEHQESYTQLVPTEAANALNEHKDVFKTWRYAYESTELSAKPFFCGALPFLSATISRTIIN